MRAFKSILPAVLLAGGLLACVTASWATGEMAKKEKKTCTFCHARTETAKEKMKSNLTDAGKYYHEKKSLDGYTPKK